MLDLLKNPISKDTDEPPIAHAIISRDSKVALCGLRVPDNYKHQEGLPRPIKICEECASKLGLS